MLVNMKVRIICSAIHFDHGNHIHQPKNIHKGFVVCGLRHHNIFYTVSILNPGKERCEKQTQGFLTSDNRFVNREEAAKIAFKSGQILKEVDVLFSEDLY